MVYLKSYKINFWSRTQQSVSSRSMHLAQSHRIPRAQN
jgi:hypothetical protein